MGVIIKYLLDFRDAKFKVSNDVLSGDFIIDADIHAAMMRGEAGGWFKITLYDLPKPKVEELHKITSKIETPIVQIWLGYFDGLFKKVMEGVYNKIECVVKDDKFVTTIKGSESATYALWKTNYQAQKEFAGEVQVKNLVTALLGQKGLPHGLITKDPIFQNISETVKDKAFQPRRKLMEILRDLATTIQAELLVSDNKVRMGKPITNDDTTLSLDKDQNLAAFNPFSMQIPEEMDPNVLEPVPAAEANGFKFIITGHPELRPAQKLVPNVRGFDVPRGTEFRVYCLAHQLSTTGGYTCDGIAIKAGANGMLARRAQEACERNASAFVQGFNERIQNQQRQRPVVEIGKIKTYTAEKHLGLLYFGQKFDEVETQPSIRAEVETNEQQLFRNKPIVSPFAWHKCGLVVPVYPGMKAVLNHNLARQDDALMTGFIWSEKPVIEPPRNKAGDWWLCLPIDFDPSNPPTDSTKAVNDLTANNGKRVLQVKGLKVTVGTSSLGTVGNRPSEGNDDEFLIEHSSGTKIQIASDGSLSIEAKTLSIKADVTIQGNVEIK